jgi:4-hydroxyproline epimerase
MHRVHVIDSHTEGEPTRVIVAGGPDLGAGSVADQLRVFRERYDAFRSAVVNEPRGSDPLVGAMIVRPSDPRAVCGVIFFNNVGFLNACGHGTIGLAVTLSHLGRIGAGSHVIETPVGTVTVDLAIDGAGRRLVSIRNVPSYRHARDVPVEFEWNGSRHTVRGDIAWGGNWFFLVPARDADHPHGHSMDLTFRNIDALTRYSSAIKAALSRSGITGDRAGEIDHVELFGPPTRRDCHSRNFVLCPGGQYDRSPCGTGTSAKLACLHADGVLKPGQAWGQESVIGSAFFGRVEEIVTNERGLVAPNSSGGNGEARRVTPIISGGAWITAESTLLLDPSDPFRDGIRVS